VARIGGDEFAMLAPGRDARDGEEMIEAIANLVALANQFYSGAALSFAMGAATSRPGERLEAVVRRADTAMYGEKRAYYSDSRRERRGSPASRRTSPASPYGQAPRV
jgi:GGDEF domain-containing protein